MSAQVFARGEPTPGDAANSAKDEPVSDGSTILATRRLALYYGKFAAVGGVDLDLKSNTLHSLIGPNGAGKTSLFNVISGRIPASRGSISFDGRDITRLPARDRAKLGMARSFQITSLFPESTVMDNLRLASMGIDSARAFGFWRTWVRETEHLLEVDLVLRELGLSRYAHSMVNSLAQGVQRVVEIAMCLVAKPRLLLLDEPLAGLGMADVPRIAELLQQLKSRYTVLLVEHNMRVVMQISDRITVMFQGTVLAEGTPQHMRENAEVRRVYLGSQS